LSDDPTFMSVYARLGVRRVVNACGVYTDLGGSCLSSSVWAAAAEANLTWASLPELLDRSGERLAALCGAQAARVVPGASAGIALAVAACVAGDDGAVMEALPACDATVVLQRGHAYKYARCAALAGARVVAVEDVAGALRREPAAAAVLHPGHLDGVAGTLALAELAPLARAAGVPVVVDAAYLSDPVSELRRWAGAGDLACFSAKYFGGPNAGGFVSGRREAVAALAALDFTGYESGRRRTFGRAWKLDRATVVATVVALEEWIATDHEARRRGHAALASALAARVRVLPGARVSLAGFTLDERLVDGPVNAVVLDAAAALEEPLAARDPSVRALAVGDALVLCTEALGAGEIDDVGAALEAVWPG
jgi:D-glucosaminate-6-phosphate ammonia-lyase